MIPKIHSFRHSLLELEQALQGGASEVMSLAITSCEMNEDVVGKTCRVYQRIDSTYGMKRTLQAYLIKVRLLRKDVDKRLRL